VGALVDILGFWDIVESMTQSTKNFELICDVLKTIQKQERILHKERVAENKERVAERQRERRGDPKAVSLLPPSSHPEMTAFSDCYVISNKAESGWQVLSLVQAMAAFLLYKGILLRGGIVKGKAFHKDRVLFGPAVITACEMEKNTSKYPRIVVEDRLVRSEWWLQAKGKFFVRDADGCWFVNPLTPGLSRLTALLPELRPNREVHDFLVQVRTNIVRLLSKETRNRRRKWDRIAKLRWLALRFNDSVKAHPGVGVSNIDLSSL